MIKFSIKERIIYCKKNTVGLYCTNLAGFYLTKKQHQQISALCYPILFIDNLHFFYTEKKKQKYLDNFFARHWINPEPIRMESGVW